MARVKLSAIITEMNGKIGGSVFQRTQSGTILKNKSNLSFTNSMAQNVSNNIMYRCQYQWQQLTACQRQLWNSFATYTKKNQKHSSNLIINGHQLFIQCNSYRFQYGYDTLTDPQIINSDIDLLTCEIGITPSHLVLSTDRYLISNYEFIILQATTKVSPSLNNVGSRYKTIVFETTDSDGFDLTQPYLNVFGFVPVVGNVIFIKYTVASKYNGLILPFKTLKTIIT